MRLLIDTGCSKTIIRPYIIQNYYPDCAYTDTTKIKTCHGQTKVQFKAQIPAFEEFNTDTTFNVLVFDFHEFYDGLIGFEDLSKLNLNLNFEHQLLYNDFTSIPYYLRVPDENSKTYDINPYEIVVKEIPVNIVNGEILVPSFSNGIVKIPETVTIAKNGLATVELHNFSEHSTQAHFDQPLNVLPFKDFESFTPYIRPLNKPKNKINLETTIRSNHLNSEERSQLFSLFKKHPNVFYFPEDKLSFTNQVKHEIKTHDENPVFTKSYRYPYVHKQEVQKQINKMLQDGIIRPSSSPWSSPIWVVPKKLDASGQRKWRIVVDYRKVNEKTITDRYPLPNITDILDKLGRCNYFTTLDLASGFHQIEMHPNSIQKTAFSVENGHFEYLRMPFGLKNAPSTFQRVMDNVLKELQNKICLVYMDDIIIFSTSLQEHIQNLDLVFKALENSNLKIQLDKSEFLCKSVEFLGHIITPEGVKPNPKKIEAIKKFPIPKTPKEIKSFLGLLGYYRKFIPNFAKTTKPMTACLKKDQKIILSDEYVKCFHTCQTLLSNEPVLAYPDFSKPFVLECDASKYAIGSVLSQDGHPISYYSRTLNPAEINYSTIEKELLSCVDSCKFYRPYLFGNHFTIMTDHQPLQWLFNLKNPNSRLIRWRLRLDEYDYEIKYKRGKQNVNADCLSRPPIAELNAVDNDTDSMIANPSDLQTILDALPEPDQDIATSLLNDLDENTFAINNESNDDDNNTVHTSLSNPTFTMPYAKSCLNMYKHQYIIKESDTAVVNSHTLENPFKNYNRHIIILKSRSSDEEVFNFLKQFLKLGTNLQLCFNFQDKTIEKKIIRIFQRFLRPYKHLSCIISNDILEDVNNENEQQKIIKHMHEAQTIHRGWKTIEKLISRKYYWPNLRKTIEEYIQNCNVCKTCKYDRHPQKINYQHVPVPQKPLDMIHIDLFFFQNKIFLTIFDPFSKLGQVYPLMSKTGIEVQKGLLNFIQHYGKPYKIVCDQGTEFNNTMIKDYCELHKISLHFTSTDSHTSNSPVERFHSSLIDSLRCLIQEKPNFPLDYLMKLAVIGYNESIHSLTKHTPFEVVFGHLNKPSPFEISDEIITSEYIQEHKDLTKNLYEQLRVDQVLSKEKIIDKVNERRTQPRAYKRGEIIYIRNSTSKRSKAVPKFFTATVLSDNGPSVITNKGQFTKNQIRKTKVNINENLQESDTDSDNEPLAQVQRKLLNEKYITNANIPTVDDYDQIIHTNKITK